MTLLEQIEKNTAPGSDYEEDQPTLLHVNPSVRVIAFYLPQFHSIAENDAWWGKGFTEWTNVTKAIPRFIGHYQPHLPVELGFYDLRRVDVLRDQAALAKRYGIHGFCFHHYWFAGKTLLDTPLKNLLANPDIDLPYFINWANENWSRRWDGRANEMLIEQQHSPDDDLAFAKSLEPFFRDPRYIRVDNRPMLGLYRPGVLPEAAKTVERWRTYFQQVGLGNPYIVMPQAHADDDPRKFGIDAAMGFPPHAAVAPPLMDIGWDSPSVLDNSDLLDERYKGRVVRYEDVAARAVRNKPTDFPYFPGVCPAWDNEARKPNRGTTLIGSTPNKYGRWLEKACQFALAAERPDERIVFVNAWNEWAEGAHLEPDRHFGYAYLAETARVLNGLTSAEQSSSNLSSEDSISRQVPLSNPTMFLRRIRRRAADELEALAFYIRP